MSNPSKPGRSARRARSAIRLLVSLTLVAVAAVATPASAEPTVITGIVYKSTPTVDIKLDVYMPEGDGPFPAVVMVHGGSWRRGWRGDMAPEATQLAARGLVAFVVDFRMPCYPDDPQLDNVDPNLCHYLFPIPIQDIGAAVAWVRVHGSEYKAIPGRAGILGGSSGGNLAMEVGVRGIPGTSLPDAIVSWSGRGDMTTDLQYGSHNRKNYIGCGYNQCTKRWKNASPSLQVGVGDAPLYLSGGELETYDPKRDQEESINAWTAMGIPTQWHLVAGSGCHSRKCIDADPTIMDESAAWLVQWVTPPVPPP